MSIVQISYFLVTLFMRIKTENYRYSSINCFVAFYQQSLRSENVILSFKYNEPNMGVMSEKDLFFRFHQNVMLHFANQQQVVRVLQQNQSLIGAQITPPFSGHTACLAVTVSLIYFVRST